MADNHENITLKEEIKKKLKESDYSPDMKAELEQLNNSTNSLQVRKMIWAVLVDNEEKFLNDPEEFLDGLIGFSGSPRWPHGLFFVRSIQAGVF